MKKVLGIVPLAMLLLGAPALSGELSLDRNKVHIGSGVICDTHEEVQRFVSLMASKDAGATSRLGPAKRPLCRSAKISAKTCMVLPRPISSARQAPSPSDDRR